MVAFVLALFVLIVLNYRTWMEDAPPPFLSFVSSKLWYFSLNKRHFVDPKNKKNKKKKLLVILDMDAINGPTNREKQRLIRKIIQYNRRTLKWLSQSIK